MKTRDMRPLLVLHGCNLGTPTLRPPVGTGAQSIGPSASICEWQVAIAKLQRPTVPAAIPTSSDEAHACLSSLSLIEQPETEAPRLGLGMVAAELKEARRARRGQLNSCAAFSTKSATSPGCEIIGTWLD